MNKRFNVLLSRMVFLHNNKEVIGEIVERQKFYIKVKITRPYSYWYAERFISSVGRQTPHHFLTERGDVVIQELLNDSYQKLKIIDRNIDRFLKVYNDLKNEIIMLSDLENNETKRRIEYKLNDWFYHDFIFTSGVSGLYTSINERELIDNILNTYKLTGQKVYLDYST